MPGRRTWCAALVLATVLGTSVGPVSAEGSGGATARLIGRGDIVTTILRSPSGGGRSRPVDPARCRWITFDDAQTEFLVAIAASARTRPHAGQLVDDLADLLESQDDPDVLAHAVLQGQQCDGVVRSFRLEPSDPSAGTTTTRVARRMITRLPQPELAMSPPAASDVPVSQPVFVSVPPRAWQPISAELSDGVVVVEVRATPIGLRTFSGVPGSDFRTCDGPGRPFDPTATATVAEQAAAVGACTLRYGAANHAAGGRALPDRPTTWIGTVSVLWAVEWREAPGPWRSLGVVPRTRIVERSVTEVATSIERPTG